MQLSIVIPIFDEEGSVELLHEELVGALEDVVSDYELIFIDDGSSDRSLERLRSIASKDPRVKVIRFRRNYGQTAAIQAGFDNYYFQH